MTFKKFEELFLTKYPNGEVVSHGDFGGTERNMKTTVVFSEGGKCYQYYGAYEDVLVRLGINVVSKSRLMAMESTLAHYKEMDGEEDLFFGTALDYSEEIKEWTARIEDLKNNYIIV